jgi:tetratricopeptide (TPR) repeat protein
MRSGLVFILALALVALPTGCRLPGREGPVSRALVSSRQFSQQGVAAIERGRWDQAQPLLAQAVEQCPFDPDARRHYAEALWHGGEREEAVLQLEEAIRLAPDVATLHVLLAQRQLAMGHGELARQTANCAIDLKPTLAGAWAIRGRVLRASGRARQALADSHRALGLAPGDRTIQLEIAQLHQELNQPRRALAALQSLADTYPSGEEPQQVLYLQGLAYSALERWDDAVRSLSAASVRGRPSAEILSQLARAELSAGRRAEAAATLLEALLLDPEHGPSRELAGQLDLVFEPDRSMRR